MRIPRWWACLFLGVGCSGLVGCSQTSWLRPNSPPEIKTVASINGKPVSTVSGEPGSGTAQREDADETAPRPASGSRISGRVLDEEGRPVPNAVVRLGVGGSSGGRVNFATTDRSGAFTLHRLRAGANYTLIAESQGEDGLLSGRVQTRAPGSAVQITVAARDREAEAEPRGGRLLGARMRSALFPDDETDGFPGTVRPRLASASAGGSDADPAPDEETRQAARPSRLLAARSSTGTSAGQARGGWSGRQRPAPDRSRSAGDADDRRGGPPEPGEMASANPDDGENPLPPALESRAMVASRPAARSQRSSASPPRRFPEEALDRSSGVAPASYSRSGDEPADDEATVRPRPRPAPRTGSRPPVSHAVRSSDRPAPADATDPDMPAEDRSSSPPPRKKRRPTWRELAISPDDVPVDEALRRSSLEEEDSDEDQGVVRAVIPQEREPKAATPTKGTGTGTSRRTPSNREAGRSGPATAPPRATTGRATGGKSGSVEGVCRMDPAQRRILDLQLPGLDGGMVSLKDFDADIIILDFWGSWCRECVRSIEHHRNLQEEFGGRKVQVIGIACEKPEDFPARRKAAEAAARQLGINYPVLVTGMQGACPVQRALRVQFYPTMVVLDREGNILQFEQGATDVTLGRIDRTVEARVDRP